MNTDLFKAHMYKNGMVGKDVAASLGIAENTLSMKINERDNSKGNKAEFTQSEIKKLKSIWNLNNKEVIEIFLIKKCLF